jgi:LiaI-LiaF-like transmembrane region
MTDPIDQTQPHEPGVSQGAPAPAPAPAATTNPTSDPVHPLRVDPDRPADSGWREPAWFPPRNRHDRDRRPSTFAVVVGLILIAIGGYSFLDRTLGIAMPRIQWSSAWPVILIVIGGLILLRSFQRKA